MSSNLPPGVTDSMIPGNRSEDFEWDMFWAWAHDVFMDTGITVEQAYGVINNGLKTVRDDGSTKIEEIEPK